MGSGVVADSTKKDLGRNEKGVGQSNGSSRQAHELLQEIGKGRSWVGSRRKYCMKGTIQQ